MNPKPDSLRRTVLTAAVAAGATGLGAWWALRSDKPSTSAGADASRAASGKATGMPELGAEFWGLSFDRPEGGTLQLSAFRTQVLLLNFWATWCPPCVKEMPLFDGFYRQRQAQGWNVVGLAIDGPTPVRDFLKRNPVSFPIGLAGLTGSDLAKQLGNSQGGLPFTLLVSRSGQVLQAKMGETSAAELKAWAEAVG